MKKNIYDKINDDLFHRSYKNNFKLLNNNGYSTHEFNYRLAKSENQKYKDFYFVVSRIFEYFNMSMINNSLKVYVYDIQGNYVKDDNLYKELKGNFFKTLEYYN